MSWSFRGGMIGAKGSVSVPQVEFRSGIQPHTQKLENQRFITFGKQCGVGSSGVVKKGRKLWLIWNLDALSVHQQLESQAECRPYFLPGMEFLLLYMLGSALIRVSEDYKFLQDSSLRKIMASFTQESTLTSQRMLVGPEHDLQK